MESNLIYKSFSRDKTIEELLYNTSLWTAEFAFVKIELAFIKKLIKAYPFTATIPNLYERLQLFALELDNLEKAKNNIAVNIENFDKKLSETTETLALNFDHYALVTYEKLAEEVFMYMIRYKNLKIQIFEYMNGLMK